MSTEPSASRIACGTWDVVANGSAVVTATCWRCSDMAIWSARASSASGIHRKYDEGCATTGRSASTRRASAWRTRASSRLACSSAATVPSSIHMQAMADMTAGVFQVELRITRSMAGSQASGAAMKPTRRPAATLLDRPDT